VTEDSANLTVRNFLTDFHTKFPSIKFDGNPSTGCNLTQADRRTWTNNRHFRDYAKVLSNHHYINRIYRGYDAGCSGRLQLSSVSKIRCISINRLTPNDPYMGRTASLTSKICILCIYSTNIGTEYFKNVLYSPFFSLQNAVCFIMLTCLVPGLVTVYIQDVLK